MNAGHIATAIAIAIPTTTLAGVGRPIPLRSTALRSVVLRPAGPLSVTPLRPRHGLRFGSIG